MRLQTAGQTAARPTRVEDYLLVCTTTMASGIEREVRFEFGDGDDLFVERARFGKED